jgi:uncharacterized protein (DUF1330 family)
VSVYFLIEISIKNKDIYSEYLEKVKPIIEKYKGKYLARGGEITSFSKNWNPERIVIIEFPTIEMLKRCLNSVEYKKISYLRENSTVSKAIVVEGIG